MVYCGVGIVAWLLVLIRSFYLPFAFTPATHHAFAVRSTRSHLPDVRVPPYLLPSVRSTYRFVYVCTYAALVVRWLVAFAYARCLRAAAYAHRSTLWFLLLYAAFTTRFIFAFTLPRVHHALPPRCYLRLRFHFAFGLVLRSYVPCGSTLTRWFRFRHHRVHYWFSSHACLHYRFGISFRFQFAFARSFHYVRSLIPLLPPFGSVTRSLPVPRFTVTSFPV